MTFVSLFILWIKRNKWTLEDLELKDGSKKSDTLVVVCIDYVTYWNKFKINFNKQLVRGTGSETLCIYRHVIVWNKHGGSGSGTENHQC